MPRKTPYKIGDCIVSVNFGERSIKQIDAICTRDNVKRSEAVRRAIALYFSMTGGLSQNEVGR